jgi:hypothetical protein
MLFAIIFLGRRVIKLQFCNLSFPLIVKFSGKLAILEFFITRSSVITIGVLAKLPVANS